MYNDRSWYGECAARVWRKNKPKNCVTIQNTIQSKMSDHFYEIALTMLPGIGCRSARQLLEIVDSAEALFNMSGSELRHIFGQRADIVKAIKEKSVFNAVEKELKFVEKNKIRVLYYKEADFPQRLNLPGCVDSPIVIYTLGNADLNPERAVSVVGTRKATVQGIDLTHKLVTDLRGEGITIVSGLAIGIDAASHSAAIECGLPTVGVLAHGLNRLYPPQNRNLAKQMLACGGSLLTEIRTDIPMKPGLFPARNRIIAALSDATVVVEASRKGGALITMLIRDADDLMLNMGWEHKTKQVGKQTTLFPKLNADEQAVYDVLAAHQDIAMDEIPDFCDLAMPKIAAALLSLELKNLCRCLPGKIYKIL